jgi:hypothetical protein
METFSFSMLNVICVGLAFGAIWLRLGAIGAHRGSLILDNSSSKDHGRQREGEKAGEWKTRGRKPSHGKFGSVAIPNLKSGRAQFGMAMRHSAVTDANPDP